MNDTSVSAPGSSPPGTRGKTAAKVFGFVLLLAAIAACLFLLSRERSSNSLVHYALRTGVVVLALAGWYWSQSLIGSRGLRAGEITDGIHELTAPLHRFLLSRPGAANGVLIVSSLFIDIFGIFLICAGIFGPSMRPFVALLILFALRQCCQALCALPAPKDMIWRHPGFPSLLVTYSVGNDFFFSGHTAVAVLGAVTIAQMFPWWLGAAAGVVALLEAVVVLVLRAHYTMDIFGAVCAAWCAVAAADWLFAIV